MVLRNLRMATMKPHAGESHTPTLIIFYGSTAAQTKVMRPKQVAMTVGTAPSTNAASQFHGSGEARVVSVGLANSVTLTIRERRHDHALLRNIGEGTSGRSSAPVPSGFPRPHRPGEAAPGKTGATGRDRPPENTPVRNAYGVFW